MPPPTNRYLLPRFSPSSQPSGENPSSSALNPTNTAALTATPSNPLLPSGVQPPKLLSLPDEVIRRILSFLIAPTLRGTPYYPPHPPIPLLPLFLVSTTMRRHVSRLLVSDAAWIDSRCPNWLSNSCLQYENIIEDYICAWYRLAGSNLRHFTCPSMRRWKIDPIVSVVAKYRPRLTKLDLFGIDETLWEPKIEHAVRAILAGGRESIRELRVVVGSGVSAMVAKAGMSGVRVLGMKYTGKVGKEAFLQLFQTLTAVEDLAIWMLAPLPTMKEEEFRSVSGMVKVMRVREGGGCARKENLWRGWLPWVKSVRDLKELVFRDVTIEGDMLRDVVAGVEKVEVVNCVIRQLDSCLNKAVMSKVRRLGVGCMLSWEEVRRLKDLGEGLVVIELRVGMAGVTVLGELLERLRKLRELTLHVCGNVPSSQGDRALVDGVMKVDERLRKLVIVGQNLPVEGAEGIIGRLSRSIEYLVVGLNVGEGSYSSAIIGLLRGVVKECKKIKVLHFGIFLTPDLLARDLNAELSHAIEEVERACEGLDTVWLRRNAKRLLEGPNTVESM